MKDDKKQARQDTIIAAAYAVIAKHGYEGASMLRIAKAAKASNETLYRWYGDKTGLFEAMVIDNAAATKAALEQATATPADPTQTLAAFSPLFLTMILSDRAIALNRAAAADPTGALGAAISSGGRDAIQPLIATLLVKLPGAQAHSPAQLAAWYVALLVGDLQIKRVTGVIGPLSPAKTAQRCHAAHTALFRLIGST